jgi:hypothetical protein
MQNDTSGYVVNIVPLQNVQTNVSGLDPTATLTTEVAAIRRMVDTQTKRVYTNSIASFTPGGTISFVSPTSGATGTGSSAASANIGAGTTSLRAYDSNGAYALELTSGTSSLFKVGQDGICYAQQFVTLSDVMAKNNMREWTSSVMDTLGSIHPYSFNYIGGVESIGLLAQEVEAVYPQLVRESGSTKYVNYDGMVAVLLKAVQELGERVRVLEGSG